MRAFVRASVGFDQAGDVLFIPRGWTFEASCSDDAHSRFVRLISDSQRFSRAGFVQVR